jgi:hypothetical protein
MGFNSAFKGLTKLLSVTLRKLTLVQSSILLYAKSPLITKHFWNSSSPPLTTAAHSYNIPKLQSPQCPFRPFLPQFVFLYSLCTWHEDWLRYSFTEYVVTLIAWQMVYVSLDLQSQILLTVQKAWQMALTKRSDIYILSSIRLPVEFPAGLFR